MCIIVYIDTCTDDAELSFLSHHSMKSLHVRKDTYLLFTTVIVYIQEMYNYYCYGLYLLHIYNCRMYVAIMILK